MFGDALQIAHALPGRFGPHRRTDSSGPCGRPRRSGSKRNVFWPARCRKPAVSVQFSFLMSTQTTDPGQLRRFGMTTPDALAGPGRRGERHALLARKHQESAPGPQPQRPKRIPSPSSKPALEHLPPGRKARIAVQRRAAAQQHRQRREDHDEGPPDRADLEPPAHGLRCRRSNRHSAARSADSPARGSSRSDHRKRNPARYCARSSATRPAAVIFTARRELRACALSARLPGCGVCVAGSYQISRMKRSWRSTPNWMTMSTRR